jgi:hypothetical protein
MLRKFTMPVAVALTLIAYPVAGDENGEAATLADAVKEFNQRAQQKPNSADLREANGSQKAFR